MRYNIDKWIKRIWITEKRFYSARLEEDIFGNWYVELLWKAIKHQGGRKVIKEMKCYDDGVAFLEKTHNLRIKRGYSERPIDG